MAIAPPRPCARCHRLVRGPCPTCRGTADKARGSAAARGYDASWSRYSRAWLRRFPFCGMRQDGLFHMEHSRCAADGLRVPATVTDHIHALRRGGSRFDAGNHQSLCTACNVTKGRRNDSEGPSKGWVR